MPTSPTFRPPSRISATLLPSPRSVLHPTSSRQSRSKTSSSPPRSPLHTARGKEEFSLFLTRDETKLDQNNVVQYAKEMTAQLSLTKKRKERLAKHVAELRRKEGILSRKGENIRIKTQADTIQSKQVNARFGDKSSDVKVLENTLLGLQRHNGALGAEVSQLRTDYDAVDRTLKSEIAAMRALTSEIHKTRALLAQAQKENIDLQARLRGCRVAQDVVVERYKDVERRNKAIRSCISEVMRPAHLSPRAAF
ncbi:unnamed protein product [Amoebophrya sp. A120]|nr:unnamed protein product [Amoebophrya sp. A120]|eukprot:GSA120T00013031001.1